ncbi:MAG: hypothetical protein QM770_21750 [Tepidisphaeraceae bacterium]
MLHYWARWNLTDREMDRRLVSITAEYAGRICFRSCDTDDAENRPFVQGIANVPALGCFVRGAWFASKVGLLSENEIRSVLDVWLKNSARPKRPSSGSDKLAVGFVFGWFLGILVAGTLEGAIYHARTGRYADGVGYYLAGYAIVLEVPILIVLRALLGKRMNGWASFWFGLLFAPAILGVWMLLA